MLYLIVFFSFNSIPISAPTAEMLKMKVTWFCALWDAIAADSTLQGVERMKDGREMPRMGLTPPEWRSSPALSSVLELYPHLVAIPPSTCRTCFLQAGGFCSPVSPSDEVGGYYDSFRHEQKE